MNKPTVLIIGAGFTGVATAYDLALRGFAVTVVERGELVSGTSGRTHGLLHSGGRYCVNDRESAIECIEENTILRKIASHCIEPNGGYFIGLNDSDVEYSKKFLEGAAACGIPTKEISVSELLKVEPQINPKVIKAYSVPDGTFEPLRLAFAFAASAQKYGAKFFPYHEVEEIVLDNSKKVTGIKTWNRTNNKKVNFEADMVINATGAWAGKIAKMANIHVPVKPTPGIMVTVAKRLTNTTINRLNIPDDGDIVLPQRRMAVIGTTSFEIEDVDYIPINEEQIQMMVDRGSELLPEIKNTPFRGVFMSSRPLIGAGMEARSIARTFKCYDHEESDKVGGLISIIGGKATTSRGMAEKTADLVCKKFGLSIECQTKNQPLVSYRKYYQQ
jgi:glycerol-3-phosphate dehydrogenase